MLDYRSRDDTEPLRIEVEQERTTITTPGAHRDRAARGSEPWERMLLAKWMRAPMFCRLQHRSEPTGRLTVPTEPQALSRSWRWIEACIVAPDERQPGRAYERVQEILLELYGLRQRLGLNAEKTP